jgi:hypothetical protein
MVPVLPALSQASVDILFATMPLPKQPYGWLTGIGMKKKTTM